ncbi:terpene synthase family protein [Streptomyces diastaticus]
MPAFPHSAARAQTTSVPEALALPVIEQAFPRHRHEYWPKLQVESRAWLLEKRLMPADKVTRYADELRYTDLIAGYYVGAPREVISAISDFSTWFFVWDDQHDRDAVHGRRDSWYRLSADLHTALDAPGDHLAHPEPLVAAFAETVHRLGGFLSADWNRRFARNFHAIVDAYDQEFENRVTKVTPSVADYIELRRHTFGHSVWIDLLEPTAGREIPESLRTSGPFMAAARHCQDFSAWYNDLCSLPKELAGDDQHNLGISLIRHEGLSLEEAVTEVRKRVENCVTEFEVAEKELRELLDGHLAALPGAAASEEARSVAEAVGSAVFNMRNWFSSVYWFHHESGRYRVDSWDDRSTPPYVSDLAGDA